MSIGPVAPGSPGVSTPPEPDPGTWLVQAGDTLGGIARQLQRQGASGTIAELVHTLARLNGIAHPDRIEVGQVLTLPSPPGRGPGGEDSVGDPRARTVQRLTDLPLFSADERRSLLHGALLRLTRGTSAPVQAGHPRAPDGTPLFRQGDPAWCSERLGVSGEGPTLARAGCAVTACAMALSRLGDTVVTPGALLGHLRGCGGFQGPLLDWSAAGGAIAGGPRASPGALDCDRLDRELDAGRPVLLRVVHATQGGPRQHWICLTGRNPRTGQVMANDPATGRTTLLTREGGVLTSPRGEPLQYTSDGRMVTFSPPSARRA